MNFIPTIGPVTTTALSLIFLIFFMQAKALEGEICANTITGVLQGYNQTPQGGSSGTTSYHRPSFDELNIHHDTFYSLGATLYTQDYVMRFNYYHFVPQGQTILSQDLTTHAKFIPKGSYFQASLNYHLYTLGFGKFFTLFNLPLLSWIEINLLKYHYDFSAFPTSSARNYNVTGFNLGFKYFHDLNRTVFADIEVSLPVPVANLTLISAQVGLNKTFSLTQHISFIPRIGVGLMQLDYKDNQPTPNHMCYRNAPFVTVGMIVTFV